MVITVVITGHLLVELAPVTKPAKPTLTLEESLRQAGRLRVQSVAGLAGPSDPAPHPHLPFCRSPK